LLSNEFFPSQNTPKSTSAGALPQTPLGELTALLRPLVSFKGLLRGRGEWRGRKGRTRGKTGKGEREEWGREEKKGNRENSALVVGGIDAPE